MATLTQPSVYTTNPSSNWLTTYQNFIHKAEFNRIGWAATAVAIQGCILAPALLLAMFYFGGGDWQFLVGMLSFMLVLVPVLSAMSVKYIIPTFAISVAIHVLIILIDVL
ncbi:hypothetical protein [Spirosoma radiotolerans]|uniref:Uncharacterized protein n=1 Tax=Spirosoma radiotolerans TaxID=1379870 RepID=A0A0E3V9T2_9BACT|nr:hypothetical protein [Spirosoma radiotolerans]AKD57441.1 hypothetical protein SD10_23680 [Spirosoma radiotolerans]